MCRMAFLNSKSYVEQQVYLSTLKNLLFLIVENFKHVCEKSNAYTFTGYDNNYLMTILFSVKSLPTPPAPATTELF